MTNDYRIAVIAGRWHRPGSHAGRIEGAAQNRANSRNFCLQFEEFPWGTDIYMKHGRIADDRSQNSGGV